MKPAPHQEFTISYTSRKLACVLDSSLACSIYGLSIAKELGQWIELWIVRDLWHLLDPVTVRHWHSKEMTPVSQRILREWERLRQNVDPLHRPVHVLADVLGESNLPAGCNSDLLWRWEQLAQGIDERILNSQERSAGEEMVMRDLLAFSAARHASILTLRSVDDPIGPPPLCIKMSQWGIPCQPVRSNDALMVSEALTLRNLFVHANLASLLWSGMNLCVLHLFVPEASTLAPPEPWETYSPSLDPTDEDVDNHSPKTHEYLWDGAQGFWYALNDSHFLPYS